MYKYNDYGAILRERRVELGLTQAAIAHKANVNRTTVSNAERGFPITFDNFQTIAYALGLEIQIVRRT